jgi:hypothetical protein
MSTLFPIFFDLKYSCKGLSFMENSLIFRPLGFPLTPTGVSIFDIILQAFFTAKIIILTGNLPPDGNSLRNIGLAAGVLDQFLWLPLAVSAQLFTNPTFEQQPDDKVRK